VEEIGFRERKGWDSTGRAWQSVGEFVGRENHVTSLKRGIRFRGEIRRKKRKDARTLVGFPEIGVKE